MNPGLFHSKYAVYVIATQPKEFQVERRYSDFSALRQEFFKHYPGYIIPPIPPKKVGKKLEPTFLQKRKIMLQQFLDDVLKHPMLRTSEIFMIFLSVPGKDWTKGLAKLGPAPKDIAECRTIEGQAKVEWDKPAEAFTANVTSSAKRLKEHYNELKVLNRFIAGEFEKLSDAFTKAGAIYQAISGIHQSLNEKAQSQLYAAMSESHVSLGEGYKHTKDTVLEHFATFYRYYKHELNAVEELLGLQRNAVEHTNQAEQKLWKRKEQLFVQKNIAMWEMDPSVTISLDTLLKNKALAFQEMLPKETKEAARYRTLFGYYTNKVAEEFARISKKNAEEKKAHFTTAAGAFAEKADAVRKVWGELAGKIEAVNLTGIVEAEQNAATTAAG